MPGNGTFNLTALWRALGIKNPQPTISERVQLVVQIADLSKLAPLHRPATASFGGTVPAGAGGTNTKIEITSRAPGGMLFLWMQSGRTLSLFQAVPDPALVAPVIEAPNGVWSRDTPVSLIRTGNSALSPPTNHTLISAGLVVEFERYVWLPPGVTMNLQNSAAAQSINNWQLFIRDLPAADAPPD